VDETALDERTHTAAHLGRRAEPRPFELGLDGAPVRQRLLQSEDRESEGRPRCATCLVSHTVRLSPPPIVTDLADGPLASPAP